jgi:hypothetical protein
MEPFEKFEFAIGIVWSLFTLYGIGLLIPPMDRRLREWEVRRKGIKGTLATPTRLQRVVFILLSSLATAVAFASAFHRDLGELIGVGAPRILFLMLILPGLYFSAGIVERRFKNKQGKS